MCCDFWTVKITWPWIAFNVATASSCVTFSRFLLNDDVFTFTSLSPILSRPSWSLTPPSMILVTYIPLSPGICWKCLQKKRVKTTTKTDKWNAKNAHLISNTTGNRESQAFVRFDQINFDYVGNNSGPTSLNVQLDALASWLQCLNSFGMTNIWHLHIVHGNDDIVHLNTSVSIYKREWKVRLKFPVNTNNITELKLALTRCSWRDDFRNVNRWIVIMMGSVAASRDWESQAAAAAIQYNFIFMPRRFTVRLQKKWCISITISHPSESYDKLSILPLHRLRPAIMKSKKEKHNKLKSI